MKLQLIFRIRLWFQCKICITVTYSTKCHSLIFKWNIFSWWHKWNLYVSFHFYLEIFFHIYSNRYWITWSAVRYIFNEHETKNEKLNWLSSEQKIKIDSIYFQLLHSVWLGNTNQSWMLNMMQQWQLQNIKSYLSFKLHGHIFGCVCVIHIQLNLIFDGEKNLKYVRISLNRIAITTVTWKRNCHEIII